MAARGISGIIGADVVMDDRVLLGLSPEDMALERVIDDLRLRLMVSETPSERGRVLRDLENAIHNRSPRAVEWLER